MLANQGEACDVVQALPAASRSDGAANGPWLNVSKYNGTLVFIINTGAVTGSVAYKLQDALDDQGDDSEDIDGATVAGSANGVQRIVLDARNTRAGFVRLVATVTTGPALGSALLMAHPKYVT